ncbi:hypothetical protein MAQ5080_03379 [Marinomonas aquimarina]|uniref:Uncharacterized protein n=1 Tax=Marinomonas aquimarina TaxID=295068 RepID=A0A1A8TPL0_9GAMM|nr:hypothetical protein [Marinomonas aquimarina]SBS36177.1 hypothetical protein MAQ5080_03379 [Marinomonas aquimarina]
MAIEGINNNVVSQNPLDDQLLVPAAAPSTNNGSSVTNSGSVAPASVDVSVSISAEAQQLAQDNIAATTVAQTSSTDSGADVTTASQFGASATSNNSAVAAEVNGSSGNTLNAAPSNSTQSGSVASQYNISPDSALGQTINFSA